jgi:hypothetical protein
LQTTAVEPMPQKGSTTKMFLLVAPCNLIHISGNLRGKAGWMWSLEVTLNCVIRNKPGIAYATHIFAAP